MNLQEKKQHLKKLIATNKVGTALKELSLLLEETDIHNDIVLFSSRYNTLSKKIRQGIISDNNASISRNKIIYALLDFVDSISIDDISIPNTSVTPIVHSLNTKDTNKSSLDKNQKRIALIIGCNEYQFDKNLKNPINDAYGINKELKKLGFNTLMLHNPNLQQLKKIIAEFKEQLKNYDTALFYFAGHGIQVNGANYLIPTDAHVTSDKVIIDNCLPIQRVLSSMEDKKSNVNIIILDTCRNNPFERSLSHNSLLERGLASMTAPRGSFIAYSTAPGKTASDGDGDNGLYTGELIKSIGLKGYSINQVFQKVRRSVMELSGDDQIPWESTSLASDFYFNHR